MSRLVRKPISLFSLAILFLAVPIWWRWHPSASHFAKQSPVPQSISDMDVMLLRASLDARALAAAGLSANTTTALVQAASSYVGAHPSALSSADAAYATAKREADRLKRVIESGHAGENDVQNYQLQSTALADATAQREAALNAIRAAATVNLSNEQKAVLTQIRANEAWKEVSMEFLAVERTQAQWVALRDALAAERITASVGDTLSESATTLLATARANETVAAAKASLDTNSASIASAWSAATHD